MEKIREFWGRHHLWSYVRQVKPLMALISPFFLDEPKLYRNISHIHKTESERWNMRREHFKSDLLFFRGFRRFYTNIGGSASWTLKPPKSPTSTYRKSIIGITNDKPNNTANRSFPPQKPGVFNRNWTSLCYLFPGLANAGELKLCVALSDRLDFFLSKRWTALRQD